MGWNLEIPIFNSEPDDSNVDGTGWPLRNTGVSYSVELGIRRPGRETWLCALGRQPPPPHSPTFLQEKVELEQ